MVVYTIKESHKVIHFLSAVHDSIDSSNLRNKNGHFLVHYFQSLEMSLNVINRWFFLFFQMKMSNVNLSLV